MSNARDIRGNSYPLEGLRDARTFSFENAEAQLAAEHARLMERDAAVSAAQAALHAASDAGVTAAATGTELARAASFAAAQRRVLLAELSTAQTAQRKQARALRLAELTWQAARLERAVVDRHHQRFVDTERKSSERAADDEADDLHASRRKPRTE